MAKSSRGGKLTQKQIKEYRGQLLEWYDAHARDIPWRVKKGDTPNPYYIWLSEIMCQQTTVQAVKAYYQKFIRRWPTVHDLAAAKQEEVMAEWAGLGYYARARNLHKCAQIVANDMNGIFPVTQEELKKLPGIGEYTSAAIAAIAYNEPATVVDGNVERVMARFFAVEEPLPHSKKRLKAFAALFFKGFKDRPGDLAQAFMDLGAGICIPKSPRCVLCPLQEDCIGNEREIAHDLPYKLKSKSRPQKFGKVYWITNQNGEVLFERRPEIGLLGGMVGLPTTPWRQDKEKLIAVISEAKAFKAQIHHTFTHFDLTLDLYIGEIETRDIANMEEQYFWDNAANQKNSLPTVFKKAYSLFEKHLQEVA